MAAKVERRLALILSADAISAVTAPLRAKRPLAGAAAPQGLVTPPCSKDSPICGYARGYLTFLLARNRSGATRPETIGK